MPSRPYEQATANARANWSPEVHAFRERIGRELAAEASACSAPLVGVSVLALAAQADDVAGEGVSDTSEMPPRWRAVGRRGNDGLTTLERRWFASRFQRPIDYRTVHRSGLGSAR